MTSADQDPLGWVRDHTPLLVSYQEEYAEERPLEEYTIGVATHMEQKSGVFVETLWKAGATVLFTGSEPHSTKESVVEYLDSKDGIDAYVEAGMTEEEWVDAQHRLLEREPDFLLDDGSELIARVHAEHPEIASSIIGGGEQTTAGVTRIEAMEADNILKFPVYAVNDTPMKHYFDNVHGTAESSLANTMITTNTMLSGKTVVVGGYGYCGRGIARKARGLGAQTIVTEVDPRKALEARMDGHKVTTMAEAAPQGDYFITATGNREVLREEHFKAMKDGAILANAGHFDVEIHLPDLENLAVETSNPTEGVTRYQLPDGRKLDLLADGRLVNLTGPFSKGHPAEVMDMTFAMMVVAAEDILCTDRNLEPGVYAIPDRLDRAVADRKLDTLDCDIDTLTESQQEYYEDWEHPDSHF